MSRSRFVVACLCLAAGLVGCGPTYVVVPSEDGPRRQRVVIYDTVVVRDTVRDTVRVRDAVPRRPGPSAPVVRVDTVVRTEVRTDTIYRTRTLVRTDTVLQVDTVVRFAPGPDIRPRRDTVIRTDTLTVTRVDTVRLATVDTVTITRVDTVQVAAPSGPKPRRLVLPPGHYPPPGQCRVWVAGVAPGRQAAAAPCDQLGEIPPGAFVLFAGLAWDFDYDWVAQEGAEPGSVPPEIVAVQRPGASAAPDGAIRPPRRGGGSSD